MAPMTPVPAAVAPKCPEKLAEPEQQAQALMNLMKKKATATAEAAAQKAKEGGKKRKLPWGQGVAK